MTTDQLYMAPVRGITDIIYRNAFDRHFGGIDIAITPFLTPVKGNQIKLSQQAEFIPADNRIPIIPQIIGKSPENFSDLAKIVFDLGNDKVNWNLGCPHPVMTQKKCGSGLLAHPDLVDQFLDKVCNTIENKLSVKVRLGLQESDELMCLLPVFERYPITEITIHARTGKQKYTGSVDRDMFEEYSKLIKMPLSYNGDIVNLEDFHNLQKRFPSIHKWMLGRGLFANPALALEIKQGFTLSTEARTKLILGFHDELLSQYQQRLSGDKHLIQKMVGHWLYLHESFPTGAKLYKKLKKTKTLEDYRQVLDSFI